MLALIPIFDAQAKFRAPLVTEQISISDDDYKSKGDSSVAIKGTVYNEDKELVIGAIIQIFVKGQNIGGAPTDIDGMFTVGPLTYIAGEQIEIRVSSTNYFTEVIKTNMDDLNTPFSIYMRINPEPGEIIVLGSLAPLDMVPPDTLNGSEIHKR